MNIKDLDTFANGGNNHRLQWRN